jgi:FkbM family methyltransferase
MAAGARQYDVPSKTLTTLLKEYKLCTVQLIKVDVEGAEVEVKLLDAT